MDRILLQLTLNGEPARRLFLQTDNPAFNNLTVESADLSPEIRANFDALVASVAAQYGQLFTPQERFLVSQPIPPAPHDDAVERMAYANLPTQTGLTAFEMPVLVRHFRAGVPIPHELPDFTVVLRASNETFIEVDGIQYPEFDFFSEAVKTLAITDLMQGQIARMAAMGRFDANYPVVQPEEPQP